MSERWSGCWQRWTGDEGRRCLLVVDDLADEAHLEPLIAGLGGQAVVLVTTQQPEGAYMAMEKWLSAGRIERFGLGGMTPEQGRRLVERYLERSLGGAEWAVVQEIGELVGWHPEALRLAITGGDVEGWRALLSECRREGISLVSVEGMLRRQWGRMVDQRRRWMDEVLGQLRRGGSFTPLYAADVWGVDVQVARQRLQTLEWTGMVERLEETHDVLEVDDEWWRVTPVVYRTFGEIRAGRKPRTFQERWGRFQAAMRELRLRWQLARLVYRYDERARRMPVHFGAWMVLWWFVWGVIKSILWPPIWAIDLAARRGWSRRWKEWTIVLSAEHHLRMRWAQRGRAPTEDLLLLYDARDVASFRSALGGLVGVAASIGLNVAASMVSFGAPGQRLLDGLSISILIAVALSYVVTAWSVAWRVWVAHLYGVGTWDIKLGLWVAHMLGWRE